ncbi:phage antirepressor N-terminal domain-containing protein [Sorangium sp. So ce204]|uniref:phage antirepressor N-terminal domain-containing protein n=1 Tax=Sorangium sp. So ce204 TaxID=3133288 RepID=UPI003F628F64
MRGRRHQPDSQAKRLTRTTATGARWACTVIVTVQVGNQGRPVVILPRRSIPVWAATLEALRCTPSVRPKLVTFQDDAADALAAVYLPDSAPLAERLEKVIAPLGASDVKLERRLAALGAHRCDRRPSAHGGPLDRPRRRRLLCESPRRTAPPRTQSGTPAPAVRFSYFAVS